MELNLTSDEIRIVRSALSRTIINYLHDSSMNVEVDEAIQTYEHIRKITDKAYPNWLKPNAKLQKILDSL